MSNCDKMIAAARSFYDRGIFDASNAAVIAQYIRTELQSLASERVDEKRAEAHITQMLTEGFLGLEIVSPFEILSTQDLSEWNVLLKNRGVARSRPFWVNQAS